VLSFDEDFGYEETMPRSGHKASNEYVLNGRLRFTNPIVSETGWNTNLHSYLQFKSSESRAYFTENYMCYRNSRPFYER